MIRKSFFTVIATAILLCLMTPLTVVYAQQGPVGIEANLLYSSRDAAGNLLPHISENPSIGIAASVKYPIGLAIFSGGIKTTSTSAWNTHQDMDMDMGGMGHTGLYVKAERYLHPLNLSAGHTYMLNKSDYRKNMYETILKAELAPSSQKPYVFVGMITPAHTPDQHTSKQSAMKMNLVGIGCATQNALPAIHPTATVNIDSSVAKAIMAHAGQEELVIKTNIALELEPQKALKVRIGATLLQDIPRQKYRTWWGASTSYCF